MSAIFDWKITQSIFIIYLLSYSLFITPNHSPIHLQKALPISLPSLSPLPPQIEGPLLHCWIIEKPIDCSVVFQISFRVEETGRVWDLAWRWNRERNWPVCTRPLTERLPWQRGYLLQDCLPEVEWVKRLQNRNQKFHLLVFFPCIAAYWICYVNFVEDADVRDSNTANGG